MSKDALIPFLFSIFGIVICGYSAAQIDAGLSMLFALPMFGAGTLAFNAGRDLIEQMVYDYL